MAKARQTQDTAQQTAPKVAIEVRDLVTHYGDRMILNGVNLDIYEGEIMVIMGGSGSGKSTFLRHIMALEIPTSGHVHIFGKDIAAITSDEIFEVRKKMGVAFQGGALFTSMSVGENIKLPLRELTNLDEMTMQIMARLKLEVVDLAGFEDLMPSELSGGMIKRAAMARAVIMDPKVLFCDEPSAGLDPVVSSQLDQLILRLREAMGMTIIVVTHELDSAFTIADRITMLDKGRILMVDTPDALKNSDNERVQNLLNRRTEDVILDPDEYMQRLTGEALDRGEHR